MTQRDFTDADWASLRRATPSFRNWWRAYTSQRYDSTLGYLGLGELARYVASVFRTKETPSRLRRLFTAIERTLDQSPHLASPITIAFFEDLIMAADEPWFDLRPVYAMLAGPRSVKAWRAAAQWVAWDARWDARRGFVPVHRYGKSKASLLILSAHSDARRTLLFVYPQYGQVRPNWYLACSHGTYARSLYRISAVRRFNRAGCPPLLSLEFRPRTDSERQYFTGLSLLPHEGTPLYVYPRDPRPAA